MGSSEILVSGDPAGFSANMAPPGHGAIRSRLWTAVTHGHQSVTRQLAPLVFRAVARTATFEHAVLLSKCYHGRRRRDWRLLWRIRLRLQRIRATQSAADISRSAAGHYLISRLRRGVVCGRPEYARDPQGCRLSFSLVTAPLHLPTFFLRPCVWCTVAPRLFIRLIEVRAPAFAMAVSRRRVGAHPVPLSTCYSACVYNQEVGANLYSSKNATVWC